MVVVSFFAVFAFYGMLEGDLEKVASLPDRASLNMFWKPDWL